MKASSGSDAPPDRSAARAGSATTSTRSSATPAAPLSVERVGYGHPDALLLIDEVQQEYVARYGGPDQTPLDPLMFEPPAGSFYVGYLDGRPVASGAWRRTDVIALGGTTAVEVKRMYVAPAARGLGAARQMLAHLERTAAASGADVVVLETGLAQPEAIGLYESSGYQPIPSFGFYKEAPLSRCFAKRIEEARCCCHRRSRTGSPTAR